MRIPSLAIGSTIRTYLETMQGRKSAAIGVESEHRPTVRIAPTACSPIQGFARQNQSGKGKSSVAVRGGNDVRCAESMEYHKAFTVGLNFEHRATPRSAGSTIRRPIEVLAG